MTDFITVSRGGPSADNDIPDGVYPLILTAISDPRDVDATRGPNAGKTISLIDWEWAVDAPGHPLDGRVVESSTSTASGPKSKMYSYLTALFGGTPPPGGTKLAKTDLVGRRVHGTVNHDEDGGWVRLANVSAVPAVLPATAPVVTAPVVAAPIAAPVVVPTADALPF